MAAVVALANGEALRVHTHQQRVEGREARSVRGGVAVEECGQDLLEAGRGRRLVARVDVRDGQRLWCCVSMRWAEQGAAAICLATSPFCAAATRSAAETSCEGSRG